MDAPDRKTVALPEADGGTVDVVADVLEQLRGLGYTVETWEQALAAVDRAYGLSGLEAPILLTGVGDTEEVDG